MKKEVSNRGFIILQHKEPYREWAEKWNDMGSADLESHLRCSRIYMIDFVDPDDVENVNDVVEENYKIIFETELMSWNSMRSEWPNNINFELFKEWFDFAASDIGYDLDNEPLTYDE